MRVNLKEYDYWVLGVGRLKTKKAVIDAMSLSGHLFRRRKLKHKDLAQQYHKDRDAWFPTSYSYTSKVIT